MTDYKELIVLAKNCTDSTLECRNCNCPYEGVSVVNGFCMNHLVDDLVKAMEQLIRERDAAVAEAEKMHRMPQSKHGTGGCRMTNADYIRSMSDEELAKFIYDVNYDDSGWVKVFDDDFIPCNYLNDLVKWLKQPREVQE